MTEVDQLREAVEKMHGGAATLAQSVPVKETFEGKTVWEGVVHVFDLAGNPKATRAYAWSSPIEGSTKRRFVAVLHIPADRLARGSRAGGYRGGEAGCVQMKRLFSIFRRDKFPDIAADFKTIAAATTATVQADGARLMAIVERVAAEIGRAPIAYNDKGEVFVHPLLQKALDEPGNEGLTELLKMGAMSKRGRPPSEPISN
jgi:hypothetical protein